MAILPCGCHFSFLVPLNGILSHPALSCPLLPSPAPFASLPCCLPAAGLLARLPACLLFRLPACLSACLLACMPACLPVCLPVCLSACPLACLPARLPVCLQVDDCGDLQFIREEMDEAETWQPQRLESEGEEEEDAPAHPGGRTPELRILLTNLLHEHVSTVAS